MYFYFVMITFSFINTILFNTGMETFIDIDIFLMFHRTF